jgi:putative cardiolipin synthase
MGIILDAPELARRVLRVIEAQLPTDTYEVTLDEDGDPRWTTWDGDEQVVYTKEPESTCWQRFKVGFLRMLPIESQL